MRRRIVNLLRRIIAEPICESGSADRREIPFSKIFVGEAGGARTSGSETEAFICKKEKCLIFAVIQLRDIHRTTNRGPEVILCVYRSFQPLQVVEPVVC